MLQSSDSALHPFPGFAKITYLCRSKRNLNPTDLPQLHIHIYLGTGAIRRNSGEIAHDDPDVYISICRLNFFLPERGHALLFCLGILQGAGLDGKA